MRGLTILIDMDDTIENLCETWVKFLNRRHDTNYSLEDVTEWDMTRNFPSLSREQIFAPLLEEEFWKEVRPIEGAVDCIKQLIDDGHKVYIVTASHPDTVKLKLDNVLFKYFPYIDFTKVIIASDKQMIIGDVMIDDAPHNLRGSDVVKILFTASHNKSFDARKWGMYRVNSWEEIYQYISKL
jgi:5'(3')-deoxyribonucleotidase